MVILSYILLIIAVAGAGIALVITHTALILGSLLFIFSLFLIGALVKRLNKFNTKIRIFLDAVEDKENMILFNEQSADKEMNARSHSLNRINFYTAIVYDKCSWIGETVELNLGGNLSAGVRDKEDGGWYNTTTGYYWRKGNIENPTPRAYHNCQVALHFNIVRLGEAYMNLAEAYLLKHDVPNAVKALNMTRTIHGGLSESTAATEEEAWTDYIRERNCELTNEGGDIYYSYLRWGKYGGYANHGRDAGDIIYDLDRPVYKMSISRDRSKLLVGQMTLNNSAQRKFTEKRYLLPINQSFLNTREAYGLDHVQNKGW